MSELEELKANLVDLVGDVTRSPMVGSVLLAYTWIDAEGNPQWNWVAAGDHTTTNMLGLAEGVAGHIKSRMYG